jgi:diaminopimelate epimerase
MPVRISFVKATGAGNDFVLINNLDGGLDVDQPKLARALCAPHTGVGADGLILLERSDRADFKMAYYNADGSSGAMCGNGGRCIALFASRLGITGSRCRFEAVDDLHDAEIEGGQIRLSMKKPECYRPGIHLSVGNRQFTGYSLDTGAPHTVVFVEEVESLDVDTIGRALRYHCAFEPDGTNVNFVTLQTCSAIEVRTYERGVERETLACGTGSIASASVSALMHNLRFPIDVKVRSGETLRIHATQEAGRITNILLEGPATILFSGSLLYDSLSERIL